MITPKFGQGVISDPLHKILPSAELFQPRIEERLRLLHDMHLENAVTRNRLKHTNEVVTQLAHWWDDVVFEQYPEFEDCVGAAIFSRPRLESFFGSSEGNDRNPPGHANYAQGVKYGIGREVLAKMLEGTETRAAIEEALRNLPMTARRKRGIEQQIEAARQEAEALRAEADRLEAEREAARQKSEEEARKKQAELDRIAAEKRKAEAAAQAALNQKAREAAEKAQRALEKQLEAAAKKQAAAEEAARQALEAKRREAGLKINERIENERIRAGADGASGQV